MSLLKNPNASVLLLGTMTSPSGAPFAMLRLASGLSNRGIPARAVFLYTREPMAEGDFPFRALLDHPPANLRDYVRIIELLWGELRAQQPRTVVTFLPLANVVGTVVARMARVGRRIVSHRVPVATYSGAMQLLDRIAALLGFYTQVVAVSQSVADSCALYPEKVRRNIKVIYNGLKDWQPSSLTKSDARRKFGLEDGIFTLSAVGRLDYQKNYPMLIEAMVGLPISVKLVIAGEGPDRAELESQISRLDLGTQVRLIGPIPRGDVPDLLAAADLFVQPSRFEGQSNALLEALSAGLPCYVSDAPEQIETISNDNGMVAGAVLPVGDSSAWNAAIAQAAQDTELLTRLEPAINDRAACFTFDRMIDQFQALV